MKAIPKARKREGSLAYSGLSGYGENRSPVLPAGRVNPAKQTHTVPKGWGDSFLDGDGFHVLKTDDGKYRAAASVGNDFVYWDVGTRVYLMHDQSRGMLGPRSGFTVVGTITPDGRTAGDVPDKTMPVVVFK